MYSATIHCCDLLLPVAVTNHESFHSWRGAMKDARAGLARGCEHDGHRFGQHQLITEMSVKIDGREEARLRRMSVDPTTEQEQMTEQEE